MSEQARLLELLGRWEEAQEKGQTLSPADLCPDDPELAGELTRRIGLLKPHDDRDDSDKTSRSTEKSCPTVKHLPSDETVDDLSLALRTDFQNLRMHGKGGLGIVYAALDRQLHREVAVKFMKAKTEDVEEIHKQLVREAEITGRLEHPGVVPVYGLGTAENGRPFYVMRFIQGESLEAAIHRYHRSYGPEQAAGERNLEFRNLLSRFTSVCYTVAYAHNRGILHRDIKPDNIMLGKYGETLLVDWGLAMPIERDQQARASGEKTLLLKSETHSGDSSGNQAGTPAYMSPEQANGAEVLTAATDIYSLGATLYKILTGETPCKGRDAYEVIQKVREGQFPKPSRVAPRVPRPLESICLKAMALKPEARYASPLLLASDIEHWLADEAVSVHPESRSNRIGRWVRHHRGPALAAALGAAAVLLVAVFSAIRLGQAVHRERQAREASIQFAAKFAARMIATEMDLRWRVLEGESLDPKLVELLTEINLTPEDRSRWAPLQHWLNEKYIKHMKTTRTSAWFIDDRRGTLVAISGILGENAPKYLGKNFAFRDYFHGKGKDLDKDVKPESIEPITRAYRSSVFLSPTDQKKKVAFSVPIRKGREAGSEVIGVLAMTVDIGAFATLQTQFGADQMAVLVDTRPDRADEQSRGGLILHHKRLSELQAQGAAVADFRVAPHVLERLLDLRKARIRDEDGTPKAGLAEPGANTLDHAYEDPVGPPGESRWIAAFEPVFVIGRPEETRDTGWVVIVQGR